MRKNKHEDSQQGYDDQVTSRSPSPMSSDATARIYCPPNQTKEYNNNPFIKISNIKDYKKNFVDLYLPEKNQQYYKVEKHHNYKNSAEPRKNRFYEPSNQKDHKRSLSEEFFSFMVHYTSEIKNKGIDHIFRQMDCSKQPNLLKTDTYYQSQFSQYEFKTTQPQKIYDGEYSKSFNVGSEIKNRNSRRKNNVSQQFDKIGQQFGVDPLPQNNVIYIEEVKLLEFILNQNAMTEFYSYLIQSNNTHDEVFYVKLLKNIKSENISKQNLEQIEIQIQYIVSILQKLRRNPVLKKEIISPQNIGQLRQENVLELQIKIQPKPKLKIEKLRYLFKPPQIYEYQDSYKCKVLAKKLNFQSLNQNRKQTKKQSKKQPKMNQIENEPKIEQFENNFMLEIQLCETLRANNEQPIEYSQLPVQIIQQSQNPKHKVRSTDIPNQFIEQHQLETQVYERETFNVLQVTAGAQQTPPSIKITPPGLYETFRPSPIQEQPCLQNFKHISLQDVVSPQTQNTIQNFNAGIIAENLKPAIGTDKTTPEAENSEIFSKAQYYLVSEQCDQSLQTQQVKNQKDFSVELEKFSERLSTHTRDRLRLADSRLHQRIISDSMSNGGSGSNYGKVRTTPRGNIFTKSRGNSNTSSVSRGRKSKSPRIAVPLEETEALKQFQLICTKVMMDHFPDEKYAQLISVPSLFKKICQKPILKNQIMADLVKDEYRAQIETYKRQNRKSQRSKSPREIRRNVFQKDEQEGSKLNRTLVVQKEDLIQPDLKDEAQGTGTPKFKNIIDFNDSPFKFNTVQYD